LALSNGEEERPGGIPPNWQRLRVTQRVTKTIQYNWRELSPTNKEKEKRSGSKPISDYIGGKKDSEVTQRIGRDFKVPYEGQMTVLQKEGAETSTDDLKTEGGHSAMAQERGADRTLRKVKTKRHQKPGSCEEPTVNTPMRTAAKIRGGEDKRVKR